MPNPLTETWRSLGAVFASNESAGVASHFGDWQAEYRAANESAVVYDHSPWSKMELTGRDRVKFLHNLCTNDIKRLEVGSGCEAFLTNVQGKILYFVRVFSSAESLWMDTVPDVASSLLAHLERYRITEKVELSDRSAEYGQLMVIGPRASDCLAAASEVVLPALPDLGHMTVSLADNPCTLLHTAMLARPAYELRFPAARAAAVWQRLWQSGLSFGLRLMGTQAWEALRIEAGWPSCGRDIDESNLPQEVGRNDQAISFIKGCYLGQETVARIDALGHVNRHLVPLLFPAESDAPPAGAEIQGAGKVQGHVTSSAFSPALGHAIALGYVRRGQERPGTELSVEWRSKTLRAVVGARPAANAGR